MWFLSNMCVKNTNPLSSSGKYFSWFVIWSLFSFMNIFGLRKSSLNFRVFHPTFLTFSRVLSDLKSSRQVFFRICPLLTILYQFFLEHSGPLDVLGEEIKATDKFCPHILGQPPRHWSGANKTSSLAPQGCYEWSFDPDF